MKPYKVLLVDDERMILEGIGRVVDWAGAGTELVGTARNGVEAYEKIVQLNPDFVISDIAMPGLDGLQLVQKTLQALPGVRFILLTGYKEFDYARTAMQHGVRHYLLKPCNERQICEALAELIEERKEQEERERFIGRMKEEAAKMLPHVKEQFLRELVTNKSYGRRELEAYRELLGMESVSGESPVRLMLFELEQSQEYVHVFALKNIAEDLLPNVLLGATLGGRLLMLAADPDDPAVLLSRLETVKAVFFKFYRVDLTMALSEAGPLHAVRRLYRETLRYMNHRFYAGEGSLITKEDLPPDNREHADFELDAEGLLLRIKSGLAEEVRQELEGEFRRLVELCLDIAVTRSFVLELYAAMIRLCPPEEQPRFTARLGELAEGQTLAVLRSAVMDGAAMLTAYYYKQNISRRSSTVRKMIEILERNYCDPELTLGGVAGEMLYMNPDYLGKVFKQVTGETFSHYLSRLRIERAAERLRQGGDATIAELAERCGFGGNTKYFSQSFKKWMGMTPTEYRRSPE
ncbi:response regulator transcription factor [Paenibacillus macerans]|uniref:response regulator transcription factor n=1 Tax=Paenibacillus macerans TaxID=44252 RepID=UPI003D31FFDE